MQKCREARWTGDGTTYRVPLTAELGDNGYLYLDVQGTLIGIPTAGTDETRAEGVDRIAAAVRRVQEGGK